MSEKEIWKDIDGFPNYEVSNIGNIRNKKSVIPLKPNVSEWGYEYVMLRNVNNSKKNKTAYIHKTMAEAFIPNPENKPKVNHKDGNKRNNIISNLEWVTYGENEKHAYDTGLKTPSDKLIIHCRRMGNDPKTRQAAYDRHPNIRVIETGEVFESYTEAGKAINSSPQDIRRCTVSGRGSSKGLHFEFTDDPPIEKRKNSILRDFQYDAVNRMFNGCILNGGTGSGKSRTGIYYYFKTQGGSYVGDTYIPMETPKNLLVITTAKKRDSLEFEGELALFRMSTDPKLNYYDNTIVIDSWQNIKKYADIKGWQVIFDEDFLTGKGVWVRTFYKIAKNNKWFIMSASPGDTYEQYLPVFIANGFFKNKSEFYREHCVFSRYTKYPKIERYLNTRRLDRLRDRLLIDMDFERHTVQNHEDIYVNYDIATYKDVIRRRWDIYRDEPITQASGLCYILRKVVNSSEDRQRAVLELMEDHPRAIIFFSFDYEREILLNLGYSEGTEIAEWTGHKHESIPSGDKWVYLVNYSAGAEGFNCITTDTIIFYSQTYSYKTMLQASGRIDRLTTPYKDLYYYHLKSRSGIDLAISKSLRAKKKFNESKWVGKF